MKIDQYYDIEKRREKVFIEDAIKNSNKIQLEELSSFSRESTNKTLQELIQHYHKNNGTIRIIHRYPTGDYEIENFGVMARTFDKQDNKDYFIWIDIPLRKEDYLIKKYNLKRK